MIANKYDAYNKAKKVIESCTRHRQASVAFRYIMNFNKLYKDKSLYNELKELLKNKRDYLVI